MTRVGATINAFAVAAVVPAIVLAIGEVARYGDIRGMGWALVLLPFSIMATLLFAVPMFLIVARFGRINLWSTLGGGVVVGAIVAVVLRLPGGWPPASDLILMCAVGLIAAISFWLTRYFLESKGVHQSHGERAL